MYTFIIVDDEAITRKGTIKKAESLSDTLQCIGEAADGKAAIELIKTTNPDIIVTDMQMPVMDGITLLPYLSEHYPDKPLIVISGYKDFEYVKGAISANAVDYIVKPFSKQVFIETLLKSISRIENSIHTNKQLQIHEDQKEHAYYEHDIQLLQNLILGIHVPNIEINSKQLSFISSTHNMILITMFSREVIDLNPIRDFLSRNGFGDLALLLPHISYNHMSFLVLFVPENYAIEPKKLCYQIITNLQITDENLYNNLLFGVSNTHKNLFELHDAFNECSEALNQTKIIEEKSSYFFYEKNVPPITFLWEQEDEFLFRIEAGMVEKVERMIDELFELYKGTPQITISDIKYHFHQLTDRLRSVMNNYFLQTNNKSSNFKNIFTSMFSLEDLYEYYQQFFKQIAVLLKPKSIYNNGDLIEKVKTYINSNYYKNLTVEYLASLFYVNRSYLSHLFKVTTGKNYVDYLNEIRIAKAQDLLLTSSRKLSQISKSVGYDNVKYFFRVFKKLVGVTPEQYRNNRK